MKKILNLLNFILFTFSLLGQSRIVISEYLLNQTDKSIQWTINGLTFTPSDKEVIIYPHMHGFDTIYFQQTKLSETLYDTIFTKIPNGVELVLKIGCCDDMFDLVTKENYDERALLFKINPSLDFDSLDMSLLQYGKIKFEILNKPASDTLICSFAGLVSIGQMISVEKEYGWVIPCKTGYRDNIIDIYIIKLDSTIVFEAIDFESFECLKGIDLVEWQIDKWPINQEIIVKKFGLRLFNNEKVIIQMDYFTRDLKLIFDK